MFALCRYVMQPSIYLELRKPDLWPSQLKIGAPVTW